MLLLLTLRLIYGLAVGSKGSLGRSSVFRHFTASCRQSDRGNGLLLCIVHRTDKTWPSHGIPILFKVSPLLNCIQTVIDFRTRAKDDSPCTAFSLPSYTERVTERRNFVFRKSLHGKFALYRINVGNRELLCEHTVFFDRNFEHTFLIL